MAIQIEHVLFSRIGFEPLAELRVPLSSFKDAGAIFESNKDDLDRYEFAVFQTETTQQLFAIAHYNSQPREAVDLYVPSGTISNSEVESFLVGVAGELSIPSKLFVISDTAEPFKTQPYREEASDIYGSNLRVVPVPVIHWARDRGTFVPD